MLNFTFHNPVKLLFGRGQIGALAQEIPPSAKVLMTYGGGSIKRTGVYDKVKQALASFTLLEFGGIEPMPKFETLMKAVELCRAEAVDFLLAVGGAPYWTEPSSSPRPRPTRVIPGSFSSTRSVPPRPFPWGRF